MMMRVLTVDGLVEIHLSDKEERSIVGGHWNAIGVYTRTGDTNALADFESVEIAGGLVLETDPDAIDGFWFGGELDFMEVYT
jgi:hypothetical protein